MKIFFSETAGFQFAGIHSIPAGSVPISQQRYEELLVAVAEGCSLRVNGAEVTAVPQSAPTQAEMIALTLRKIDAEVDAIYAAVVGNSSIEYTEAEADASAFAAANFAGPVPQSVAAYSAAAGLTDQQAAESILAQASAWRAAVLQIRTARLAAKAGVRAGDIDAALSTWSAFVAQMRASLGV